MSGVGTHEGLTHRKRLRGQDERGVADVALDALIVDLYTDARGWAPYKPQLRNLNAAVWWLAAVLQREPGDEHRRSWPQIIRAIGRPLGWDLSGDIKDLSDRGYYTTAKRLFEYMVRMKLLDEWEPVPTGRPGEFAGIRFLTSKDARSLLHRTMEFLARSSTVRRSPRRAPHPPAASKKPTKCAAPSDSEPLGEQFSRCSRDESSRERQCLRLTRSEETAVQRPAVDANEPTGTATGGAALHRLRTAAGGAVAQAFAAGGGRRDALLAIREALEAASADGAPSHGVVIVGWEAMRKVTGHSPDVRIHPNRWRSGAAGLDVADRYGNLGRGGPPALGQPAPGVQWLLGAMLDSALWGWEPMEIESRHPERNPDLNRRARGTVASLSHFLCQIGQLGRAWRENARQLEGYQGERKGRRRGTARARRRARRA